MAGQIYLLPSPRDGGVRSALTMRLRRIGVPVVSEITSGSMVLVPLNAESGLARVERSIADCPLPHLAISDAEPDARKITEAAIAGLQGWLSSAIPDDALVAALTDVNAGGTAWRRAHMAILVRALHRRVHRHVPRSDGSRAELTTREYMVLESLAEGRTTVEVARDLGISAVTVRGYVSSSARRLNADGRTEAVELFRRTRHLTQN